MTDRLQGYAALDQAHQLLRAERDLLILTLWGQGHGVSIIARGAGLSRRAVYDIVQTAAAITNLEETDND